MAYGVGSVEIRGEPGDTASVGRDTTTLGVLWRSIERTGRTISVGS